MSNLSIQECDDFIEESARTATDKQDRKQNTTKKPSCMPSDNEAILRLFVTKMVAD